MAHFLLDHLPKEQRIQLIGEFYDTIHSLKSRDEIRAFFRDLLTPDEITMLMRRIEVAALLIADFTYEEIHKLIGVGRGKITNVQKILRRGGEGYRVAIDHLLDNRKARLQKRARQRKLQESPFEQEKRRYPGHFLLFNILDAVDARLERDSKELTQTALRHTPSRRK